MAQCETTGDPFRGTLDCGNQATARLWVHYPTRRNSFGGFHSESVEEIGRFCADCATKIALGWQESYAMEVLTTVPNRRPPVSCAVNLAYRTRA